MKRKANAPRLRETIVAAILLVIALFYLLPIVWMIAASFQGEGEIFKIPFNWLPIKEGTLNSYRFALTNGHQGGSGTGSYSGIAIDNHRLRHVQV